MMNQTVQNVNRKKRKCCFIIPYFGKLPENFQFFLNSCAYNKDFNWLIFTDDNSKYDYPENVKKIEMQFDRMRSMVQSKFDFIISLEKPYKLCDYKPAYGLIFEEYLTEFEFWGHCDCDLIFGKLNHFITEDLLENYDKLFVLGHCTLYRNSDEINRIFMKPIENQFLYRKVYTTKKSCTFDETYLPDNINTIFDFYGYRVLKDDYSANLMRRPVGFRLTHFDKISGDYLYESKMPNFFVFDKGVLKRYRKKFGVLSENEYMYIHFQSREMKNCLKDRNATKFKIASNVFVEMETDTVTGDNFDRIRKKYKSNHRIKIIKSEIDFWRKKIINKLIKRNAD